MIVKNSLIYDADYFRSNTLMSFVLYVTMIIYSDFDAHATNAILELTTAQKIYIHKINKNNDLVYNVGGLTNL